MALCGESYTGRSEKSCCAVRLSLIDRDGSILAGHFGSVVEVTFRFSAGVVSVELIALFRLGNPRRLSIQRGHYTLSLPLHLKIPSYSEYNRGPFYRFPLQLDPSGRANTAISSFPTVPRP